MKGTCEIQIQIQVKGIHLKVIGIQVQVCSTGKLKTGTGGEWTAGTGERYIWLWNTNAG